MYFDPNAFNQLTDGTGVASLCKRILFLAIDPAERESIQTDPLVGEADWDKIVVETLDEAVAAIQARPVDAIVADHRTKDPSTTKLLNWAAEHCPKAVRLILAEPEEREPLLRTLRAPHHFLPKPITPQILTGTIQSAFLLDAALPNEVLLTLASHIRMN